MQLNKTIKFAFTTVFLTFLCICSFGQLPIYLDAKQSINSRIEHLLKRMTLEEKIGQLNMPTSGGSESRFEGIETFTLGKNEKNVGPGGGFFDLPNRYLSEGTRRQTEYNNSLQKLAVEKTRLKIPLLMTEEGTHGLMAAGATIVFS